MTLLAIFGCAPATRENDFSSVDDMVIEATVVQGTERQGAEGEGFVADHVRVALQDREGRMLERDDLQVEMNDTTLGTRNAHGHYYERHPFYRLDDASALLDADSVCRFSIVRPDGTHHLAGVVRTPKAMRGAQFHFPETVARGAPLAITWTDLAEAAELVIFRSFAFTDDTGNTVIESGSPTDPFALRRTIGPGVFRRASGRFDVPASFLQDLNGRRVCALGVEVSVMHTGETRAPFSRRSVIQAIRRLVFHADLVD